MRQEIGRLAEQIDAEIVVLDTDIHVHAADDEPTPYLLEVGGDRAVARFVGGLLVGPLGKGTGRGGDWCQADLAGDAADRATEMDDLVARLLHRLAHAGADLDL